MVAWVQSDHSEVILEGKSHVKGSLHFVPLGFSLFLVVNIYIFHHRLHAAFCVSSCEVFCDAFLNIALVPYAYAMPKFINQMKNTHRAVYEYRLDQHSLPMRVPFCLVVSL